MNHNKIILITTISYVVLYILVYFIITNLKLTPSDAAGMGMESGLRTLMIIGIFFIIAFILTVVHLFLLKGTSTGIKFLAFLPILASVGHILYFFKFG